MEQLVVIRAAHGALGRDLAATLESFLARFLTLCRPNLLAITYLLTIFGESVFLDGFCRICGQNEWEIEVAIEGQTFTKHSK